MKTFIVGLLSTLLGGGAVAGLDYNHRREAEKFRDEVEDAVFVLLDGYWEPKRSSEHPENYYAFPLTSYYNATDFDKFEYQTDAAEFWTTFSSVKVVVTRVEIVEDSDYYGHVRVNVDATVTRQFRDGSCTQVADSIYVLTLEKMVDVGYRIRSEQETAIPLKC
ncbi:MAG: hypothetical protein ABI894_11205 [Ilumatobacteraceae bacterium]